MCHMHVYLGVDNPNDELVLEMADSSLSEGYAKMSILIIRKHMMVNYTKRMEWWAMGSGAVGMCSMVEE